MYRMGDYEKCASMYEKLFDEDPEDVGFYVWCRVDVASCDVRVLCGPHCRVLS